MTPPAGLRWWHEPLVHFLVIGALLFVVFGWLGDGRGSARIVITPGQIDTIAANFARTWQRPPTEVELKGQIDEYVREEIAIREATALGLDRDDTVIRRRLRQKLEFVAEDSIDATPPTDADLQAWLDAHPDTFRLEPEIAFRQVYLDPERRGASAEDDARRLREKLAGAGSDTTVQSLGDSVMLPHDVPRSTRTDVAQQFGAEFAAGILTVATGQWVGPVRSSYGMHVVYVQERQDARLPALADVRPLVEREFSADRRRRQLEAMYMQLLQRYEVVVEERRNGPRRPKAAAAHGEGGR